MAQCSKCKKEVGCGCNLKSGLCLSCRKEQEEAAAKAQLKIKFPEKENK